MSSAAATAPNAGQTVPPVPSPNNDIKNAEKAFPLAAIVCVSIVGGLVAVFVVYKLYRCIHARRQHLRESYKEPPSPQSSNPLIPPNAGPYMSQAAYSNYHPSVYARMPSFYSGSTFAGMDGGKSDLNLAHPSSSSRTFPQSSTFNSQMRTDSFGSVMDASGLVPKREGSASGSSESWPPSPNTAAFTDGTSRSNTPSSGVASPIAAYTGGANARSSVRGDSSMSTDRLRAQGSRSSLLYPNTQQSHSGRDRRSLAHVYSSSSVSVASQHSHGGSQGYLAPIPRQPRLSGPPHARHSRVEIVPPMPLAPPPGTVVATDKTTLNFSPLSGIGNANNLFASNMHLASLASEPEQRDNGDRRQHRRQTTGHTVQTSSSNASGDDVSSVGPWFSTPPSTSEEHSTPSRRDPSSNGSRGTLDTTSEEDEESASANQSNTVAHDNLGKIATPARKSSVLAAENQSPLDKLRGDLQQVASRTPNTSA